MTKHVIPIFEKDVPCVEDMNTITYCVNCVDEATGKRGTFVYDEALYNYNMGHWAISPVFQDIIKFYEWAREKGFAYHREGELLTMGRHFE